MRRQISRSHASQPEKTTYAPRETIKSRPMSEHAIKNLSIKVTVFRVSGSSERVQLCEALPHQARAMAVLERLHRVRVSMIASHGFDGSPLHPARQ